MTKDLKVPRRVAVFFRKMNRSLVQLPKDPNDDLVPEPDRRVRYTDKGLPNPGAVGLRPAALLDLSGAFNTPSEQKEFEA